MKKISGDKKQQEGKYNNNNEADDKLEILTTNAGSGKMLTMTSNKKDERRLGMKRQQ